MCGLIQTEYVIFCKKESTHLIAGSSLPMPPELMELYTLYQQELQTRQTEKEANYLSELNTMLRVG